jgi:hypothetical protein
MLREAWVGFCFLLFKTEFTPEVTKFFIFAGRKIGSAFLYHRLYTPPRAWLFCRPARAASPGRPMGSVFSTADAQSGKFALIQGLMVELVTFSIQPTCHRSQPESAQ